MIWNISFRHFKTRIEEHIKKDNNSHIFKHLHFTTTCFDSYNSLSFKTIDKANSKYDLKNKQALHINWTKPNLNAQQNHLAFTLSLNLAPLLYFFLSLFFFSFFFSFSFIYYFHYVWYSFSASFTVLMTFFYYFISLQHSWYHTFTFRLLFSFYLTLTSASFAVLITLCHYFILL